MTAPKTKKSIKGAPRAPRSSVKTFFKTASLKGADFFDEDFVEEFGEV